MTDDVEAARHAGLVIAGGEAARLWLPREGGGEILVNELDCIDQIEGEYVLSPKTGRGPEVLLRLVGIRHRALEEMRRELEETQTNLVAMTDKAQRLHLDHERVKAKLVALTEESRLPLHAARKAAATFLGKLAKAVEGT